MVMIWTWNVREIYICFWCHSMTDSSLSWRMSSQYKEWTLALRVFRQEFTNNYLLTWSRLYCSLVIDLVSVHIEAAFDLPVKASRVASCLWFLDGQQWRRLKFRSNSITLRVISGPMSIFQLQLNVFRGDKIGRPLRVSLWNKSGQSTKPSAYLLFDYLNWNISITIIGWSCGNWLYSSYS